MRARASRPFTTFVGVDLGGGKGKNTAVALLQAKGETVRVRYVGTRTPDGEPYYDEQLIAFLLAHRDAALVAIDAPLVPTVCVRCRLPECVGLGACEDRVVRWFRERGDPLVRGQDAGGPNGKPATTPYTQRACEVVLQREHGITPRETLGQGMGPLTARAHYLRRALERHFRLNANLIEVYPKATVHALFSADRARRYKREVDTWRTRAELLEELSHSLRFEVWREGCLSNDHCFDAVLCAYTGYLWATEGWTLPERDREVFEDDGWIWFPPPAGERGAISGP
ncbi:MAG: DUF429 domain-containing protein [Deltaproteobacteria bacterium]|nr:DUF429 domain-containing protein [Deltaproteobacteria bacterium]